MDINGMMNSRNVVSGFIYDRQSDTTEFSPTAIWIKSGKNERIAFNLTKWLKQIQIKYKQWNRFAYGQSVK